MRKYILMSILLIIAVSVFAADPVAYLLQGKGNVQILRAQKPIKYKNGELLHNNDEIKTGSESFAAIKYTDGGAAVKIFPNSVVRISAVKQDKQLHKNTTLQLGSPHSSINSKIKGNYQVETPTTVASVKGTGFITKVTPDRKTIVVVLEGEVLVQNKESGKSRTVGQGSTGVSDTSGEISVEDSKTTDVSESELKEIESVKQETQKTMKIQVTDPDGNVKYIEITY